MTNGSDQPTIDDRGFFGHPKGLAVLFFAELWERFSFYGMRALLVLYMYKELGYPKDTRAYGIYGAYMGLVYAFPVLGGWVANQWLGYRRTVVLGGFFMALGHFAMAIENEPFFYTALALLCVGNGFFKPNISSTVGRLYEPGDIRRDGGFTIFYMGINIGAFLAPAICGPLGENYGWPLGFSLAGFGMLVGLVWFLAGQKHIGHHGEPDNPAGLKMLWPVIIGATAIVPLAALSLYHYHIAETIVLAVSAVVLICLIVFTFQQTGTARLRMIVLIALMFFHMLFWAGFEQAGSSLTVLTDEHVQRRVFGVELPASLFQSINAFFIVLFGPVFTMLWSRMNKKGIEPSIPLKFAFGLIQLGLGFLVLNWAFQSPDGVVRFGAIFMVFCYLLHTTGELCLSPVGLSAVTKLAPKRWVGFCMGAWFLTIANAHILAAGIAKLTGDGDEVKDVAAAPSDAEKAAAKKFDDVKDKVLLALAPPTGAPKMLPAILSEFGLESKYVLESGPVKNLILSQVTKEKTETEEGKKVTKPEVTLAAVIANHGLDAAEVAKWSETKKTTLSRIGAGLPKEDLTEGDERESWSKIAARWSTDRETVLSWRRDALKGYDSTFMLIVYVTIGSGIFLILLTPGLKKLMQGVN